MKYELEDKHDNYRSIPHEKWCDLLSITEVKDNRKRATDQIKRLVTSNAELVNYGSNDCIRVMRKNKARTGVLPRRKQNEKNTPKHHGAQRYCVL